MKKNNFNILAQEWFDKADEDLDLAAHLLQERAFPAPICYHAHQAVEKYLKGFLVLNGKDIKDEFKTHTLQKLYEYAHAVDSAIDKSVKESCFVLNRYYISARYPADMPEYPWKDVEEAVKAAQRVKSVINKIGK